MSDEQRDTETPNSEEGGADEPIRVKPPFRKAAILMLALSVFLILIIFAGMLRVFSTRQVGLLDRASNTRSGAEPATPEPLAEEPDSGAEVGTEASGSVGMAASDNPHLERWGGDSAPIRFRPSRTEESGKPAPYPPPSWNAAKRLEKAGTVGKSVKGDGKFVNHESELPGTKELPYDPEAKNWLNK